MEYDVQLSGTFHRWLLKLHDELAKARILARLRSVSHGNLGDSKSVGDAVMELRINAGPGYRLYFTRRREFIVVILCGGDKSTQQRDIERAKRMARSIE